MAQTEHIRMLLPKIFQKYNVTSLLDAPCGDWNWMRHVDLPPTYIGVDIVEALVVKNQESYTREGVTFRQANLIKDPLPKTDMIFSRDCFIHLSFEDIFKALHNFKRSGIKYLLVSTYSDWPENKPLPVSVCRPIDLTKPPFNWPDPLELFPDPPHHKKRKHLGLWRLDDIEIPDAYIEQSSSE